MAALNFTSFTGAVPRYKSYEVSECRGILYLIPSDAASARRYDPFQDVNALLMDVVQAGAVVASCDAFFDYALKNEILPLEEPEFWRCGDFFVKRPKEAKAMIESLRGFAEKYGLPVWDADAVATSDYPARYEQRLMRFRRKHDFDSNISYMMEYTLLKRGCQSKGSMPLCTLALILLDLYIKFVEGTGESQFYINDAKWMLYYKCQKTPELYAQVPDLLACINLGYALLISGEGKAIRQCKHCQSFFVAEDLRAEYCSPRCRGAYNSKMTRKRVKERQSQEGQ